MPRLCGAGFAVRPFKPQNMSNNAAVAGDGREIGRAQALQARAAGIEPCVHMNPVLLKPESEHGAQVVVQGTVTGTADARRYHALKAALMPRVLESFGRLGQEADLILVEGAGSPAEVNLRENDIANMGFALAARVPVALVGDVDRGGVIASLVGTWALLPAPERALTKGFVINKFRGDATLFDGANTVIERETGWAALGLVPWFEAARLLPAEDSVSLDSTPAMPAASTGRAIKIAVPRLPRISNTDDLDPLRAEPDTVLDLVPPGRALPGTPTSCCCRAARQPAATSRRCTARAGRSTFRRTCGAAAGWWASAGATRCWATASPTRPASRGRRGRLRGSACSMSKR